MTVAKFPENSRIAKGGRFLPLNKKFIGRHFIIEDYINYETSKITPYAGGYLAPSKGNLLLGVDADGNAHIQNFDSYGDASEETLSYNLGGTGPWGKFIKQSNGKYYFSVNNVTIILNLGFYQYKTNCSILIFIINESCIKSCTFCA